MPGARRAALPKFVQPQLATLVSEAPAGESWLHEMKYDGYRILAHLDHGRVHLLSRSGHDWTNNFPPVAEAIKRFPGTQAMLDGEVVVLLPDGTSSFQSLQNFLSGTGEGQLTYMVFDLLHLDGWDLTAARREVRIYQVRPTGAEGSFPTKALLQDVLPTRLQALLTSFSPGRSAKRLALLDARRQAAA